jgi:hypothetical protein
MWGAGGYCSALNCEWFVYVNVAEEGCVVIGFTVPAYTLGCFCILVLREEGCGVMGVSVLP